ncbi:MAG TPA: hypothetical protein VHS97_05450 [Isosphaeraceae bacterium]|nr:hypothetical protein [Isosphaeraceae bacterium]
MCPCQRFAGALAVADAGLGVGMTGWVFPVRLFHSLLSAGFERPTKRTALPADSPDRPASHRVAGDPSDLRVTAADHTLRLIIEPHPPAR